MHWDSKLLPSLLCSTTSVDRLPILITAVSTGETQLLGVPKVTSGTGGNQAAAVYELLQEWCLDERLQASALIQLHQTRDVSQEHAFF